MALMAKSENERTSNIEGIRVVDLQSMEDPLRRTTQRHLHKPYQERKVIIAQGSGLP